MKPMMKCGHAANAVDKDGNPCCAICAGYTPDAFIVEDKEIDLTGRKARCLYCGSLKDSTPICHSLSIDPTESLTGFMTVARGGTDECV